MGSERRRRADELFDAALERPAAERLGWLESACPDDAALRDEVAELLVAHELAEGILEGRAPVAAAPPPATADRRIGVYRVIRELGRGGMGVVYLAERADGQFRRLVAIKLLRSSPDADELRARFRAERQILASLDHPNIAQLLDAGVTDGQLPYLVMEYVEGLPITVFCDRRRLGIGARLQLFRSVCAAVHHAHRNLVIHRDLKPGNILVTESGDVKLLDFGIAKLQNPALSAVAMPVTRADLRVMTPEYASPEQLLGEPLTTASDVYALGVVLHELLTGRRPARRRTGPGAVGSAGTDRESRPSSVAGAGRGGNATGSTAPDPIQVAAARDTTPDQLRRRLRGDLDAIVLMALREEPGRRYGSADLLAEDIHRLLQGLPVLAHRGSRRYFAGKFLRRHRLSAAVAGVALLSVVSGAGAALWQAAIAGRERDRAEAARLLSEASRRQSEAVTSFLMGLFEANDPDRARGDTVTARELMERGVDRAEALAGQPAVQARMFEVIGRVYQSMGRYEDAHRLLQRSLALQLNREDDAGVARSLVNLATLLRRRAEYDSARSLLLRAGALQRRANGGGSPEYAATLLELSSLAVQRGDLDGAESRAREALALNRRLLGPGDPATVASLVQLGAVLRERGDYPAAEVAFREAVNRRHTAGQPGLAETLGLADLLLYDRDRPTVAEPMYRQALSIARARARPDHTLVVRALTGLARVREKRGDFEGAERLLRESLELRRRSYGPEHPLVAAGMIHLAGLYERTGHYDDAVALFRSAGDLDAKVLGEAHPTHAGTLTAIGRVLLAAGRLEEADTVLERATAIRIAALGTDHPLVAKTLRQRGEVQLRRGAYAAAESTLRQALAIYVAQRTPEANTVRELHGLLARLYAAWNRPADAERHRRLAGAP